MNNFFDNQRILNLVWKRKLHFVIIGLIAIVLSSIFSGPVFIQPKFKSMVRIYPSNITPVSNESETEQMLEVVNSNDIKLKMISAFDLGNVYSISKEDPEYMSLLLFLYDKNVKTQKTEYETVEIDVLDQDPQRAADMCDSIVRFYNDKMMAIQKNKSIERVKITSNNLKRRYNELDSVKSELSILRAKYDILSIEEQVPEVTRGYMTALAEGRGAASDTKKIKEIYDNLTEKSADAEWLETRFDYLQVAIDTLTKRHDRYLSDYENDMSYSHVVEYPFAADKKSYPIRWLIVVFATVSAVFLALLVFLVLDYRKED